MRTVLKLHPLLAPIKCAVLPLVRNKPELVELAKKIEKNLRTVCSCTYDDKDAIGRRYRRQDAIGTPYCITVDFDSLEDNQVTIRDRDNLEQKRIPIDDLNSMLQKLTDWQSLMLTD